MNDLLGYKKILVAADFSPASQAALNQALWIARHSQGAITLVHVLPDMPRRIHSASIDAKLDLLYGEGSSFHKEIRSDADRQLQKMLATADAAGIDVSCKTLVGEPFVEICRTVHHAGHDLVVAGTRGHSRWQSLLVGGTASRLIRKCSAPVWIVKPEHMGAPKVVLAATDFSEVSRATVLSALGIARSSGAKTHLLHVIDSMDVPENVVAAIPAGSTLRKEINDVARRRFDEFLASLTSFTSPSDVQPHLTWGTPWQEIRRTATEVKADLISMGTIGRSGLRGLLLGNTAEKVLNTCDCSILTLKPEGFESPVSVTQ